ncbi:hypothetical protein D9M73_119650 [compost metagenome]
MRRLIAAQQHVCSDVLPVLRCLGDQLREFRSPLQPQIEAMRRHWMHPDRRVANQGCAPGDEAVGIGRREWIDVRPFKHLHRPETRPETARHFVPQRGTIQRRQRVDRG